MALEIEVFDSPDQRFSVGLEGKQFNIRLYFVTRDKGWRMDIISPDDEIKGIKLTPETNLTYRFEGAGFTEGDLWCLRTTNTNLPVGRDNLGKGKEYTLIYLTADEMTKFNLEF